MSAFQASVVVYRPVEEVFRFMTNLNNIKSVMTTVTSAEPITLGPIDKGSKYIEIRNLRGKTAKAEIEFVDFQPNQSYTTRSIVNDVIIIYQYNFTAVQGGTNIQFKASVQVGGLFSFFSRVILIKNLKSEDGNHLQNVKKLMEGSPSI